jgi:hypothetical protein
MSSDARTRGRSTAAAGLRGNPQTFMARRKIPCRTTRYLTTVRFETSSVARQRSSSWGHVLEAQVAQVALDAPRGVAVVGQRRGLAGAVVLGPAQPFRGGIGDRRARAHSVRTLAPAHLGERLLQPRLGRPLREVARRRTPTRRPGGPDPPLDLPAVGEAILRVPLRAAHAVDAIHVPGHRTGPVARYQIDTRHGQSRRHRLGHIRDTRLGRAMASHKQVGAKAADLQGRSGEGVEPSKRRATTPCRF